jgi:hypothetical protein
MAFVKSSPRGPRRIWRMTPDAPQGAFVDSRAPDQPSGPVPLGEPEVSERSWLGSSLELAAGVRVTETPADTLPGDLFDQLFKR